jgi:hypothetical protein
MTEAVKDDDNDKITVEKVEDAFREADIAVEKVATPVKKAEKSIVTAQEGVEELRRKLAAEAEGRQQESLARQEAERRAQHANQEAFRARNDADATGMQLVDSAIGALKSSKAALKEAYKQALVNQDFDRAAEVQDEMSTSAAKLTQLETAKQAMANRPKQAAPVQIQSDPVEAMASQLTPRSAAWVRSHPEYARDNRLRDKMIAAHNLAVADGFVADTDDYFREVESALKIARPQEQASNEAAQPVQRRSSPAAAPVSRSGTAPGSNPRVVRLTAEEIEIAEMSGLTPEQYAKNKMALKAEDRLH